MGKMGNFITRYRAESIWNRRGAAAFALAPFISAFVYSALFTGDAFLSALPTIAIVSYLQTLVLGLPFAFLLNWRRKVSLLTTAISSGVAGALPWVLFLGNSVLRSQWGGGASNPDNWIALLAALVIFGGLGGIGGVAWWFISKPPKPTPISATVP
jgi:hypothetical protein